MRKVYVIRNGVLVDKYTGEPAPETPNNASICAPMIMSDYKAYVSPVSGKVVDGKHAHKEDLKRSGCRLIEPGEQKYTFKNEKFCKKRGIEIGSTVT